MPLLLTPLWIVNGIRHVQTDLQTDRQTDALLNACHHFILGMKNNTCSFKFLRLIVFRNKTVTLNWVNLPYQKISNLWRTVAWPVNRWCNYPGASGRGKTWLPTFLVPIIYIITSYNTLLFVLNLFFFFASTWTRKDSQTVTDQTKTLVLINSLIHFVRLQKWPNTLV